EPRETKGAASRSKIARVVVPAARCTGNSTRASSAPAQRSLAKRPASAIRPKALMDPPCPEGAMPRNSPREGGGRGRGLCPGRQARRGTVKDSRGRQDHG